MRGHVVGVVPEVGGNESGRLFAHQTIDDRVPDMLQT